MTIQELEQEIVDCNFCPFLEYDFNRKKELGFGKERRIMFIGSSPAITSNRIKGNSKFDKFFEKLLTKVDISKEEYYFTNLIKTAIPKNVEPTDEQLKHCYSHLVKEIMLIKPQIIVILGKLARKPFGLKWPDSKKKFFFTLKDDKHSATIFTLSHPGALHYAPEQEEEYIKKLKKILTNYQPTLF